MALKMFEIKIIPKENSFLNHLSGDIKQKNVELYNINIHLK